MMPPHPFALCQRIHLAHGPEAEGCIACKCDEEKKRTGRRVSLCATCKEAK
jgi:hypothetical protein